MKQSIRKMTEIILAAMLILMLPGIGNTAAADEDPKPEYTIRFSANGNTTERNVTLSYTFNCIWNFANGKLDEIIQELYELGNYKDKTCDGNTVPSVSSGFDGLIEVGNITGGYGNSAYIKIIKPFTGTAVMKGNYFATETDTQETINYSLSVECFYNINLGASDGGTITAYSSDPGSRKDEDVSSSKWTLSSDLSLTAIAKADKGYQFVGWYEATVDDQGNITGHTDTKVSEDKQIVFDKDSKYQKLQAVFAQGTLVESVALTVDPPIGGNTVTADPDDLNSQWPIPTVTVPDTCHIRQVKIDPTDPNSGYRDHAYWINNITDKKAFSGEFVTGEEYYGFIAIEPNEGYRFSAETAISVNGTDLRYDYDYLFFLDQLIWLFPKLRADDPKDYEFTCDIDEGASWTKGSGSTMDFRFDRKKGGATKDNFLKMFMDGEEVSDQNAYKVETGSILLKLQPDYLNKLSTGSHDLKVLFSNEQSVEVKFAVVEQKKEEEKKEEEKKKTVTAYKVPVTGVE